MTSASMARNTRSSSPSRRFTRTGIETGSGFPRSPRPRTPSRRFTRTGIETHQPCNSTTNDHQIPRAAGSPEQELRRAVAAGAVALVGRLGPRAAGSPEQELRPIMFPRRSCTMFGPRAAGSPEQELRPTGRESGRQHFPKSAPSRRFTRTGIETFWRRFIIASSSAPSRRFTRTGIETPDGAHARARVREPPSRRFTRTGIETPSYERRSDGRLRPRAAGSPEQELRPVTHGLPCC